MRLLILPLLLLITACEQRPPLEHDTMDSLNYTPYGSWPSPVSAASTVAGSRGLHTLHADQGYLFGVSDIEALAHETHKFESRYLDQLIGPYPQRKDLYVARSPIHHLGGFSAPLLLLQGLDDKVVPPNQSEMIFAALKSRKVPTAYVTFEGEGHGFRRAENQVRAMEAELYFYGRVLGFELAEEVAPVEIIGLDR